MIAKHPGHNKVQITARYAHLARDSIKTAGERVAVSLAAEIGVFRHYMRSQAATVT